MCFYFNSHVVEHCQLLERWNNSTFFEYLKLCLFERFTQSQRVMQQQLPAYNWTSNRLDDFCFFFFRVEFQSSQRRLKKKDRKSIHEIGSFLRSRCKEPAIDAPGEKEEEERGVVRKSGEGRGNGGLVHAAGSTDDSDASRSLIPPSPLALSLTQPLGRSARHRIYYPHPKLVTPYIYLLQIYRQTMMIPTHTLTHVAFAAILSIF